MTYNIAEQTATQAAALTAEADRLLREVGATSPNPDGTFDCQPEDELIRRHYRNIARGYDVSWADDCLIVPDDIECRIPFRQLLPYCTAKQRQYVRLVRKLGTQQAVADHLRLTHRSAVSHVLARAWLRIQAAAPVIRSREPSPGAWRMFLAELRRKKRLVYRRPSKHWVSAYRRGRVSK